MSCLEAVCSVAGRASAAAGQSGLMALYDSLFGLMDCQAAQVLVTSNDFADADFRKNLSATVEDLLSMNVVPVFNENDAISRRSAQEQVLQSWQGPPAVLLIIVWCSLTDVSWMTSSIVFWGS